MLVGDEHLADPQSACDPFTCCLASDGFVSQTSSLSQWITGTEFKCHFLSPIQLCPLLLRSHWLPEAGDWERAAELHRWRVVRWCPVQRELQDGLHFASPAGRWSQQEPGLSCWFCMTHKRGMSKWGWRSGEITQPRAQNLSSALGQDLIQIFRFRIGAVWLWNEVLIVRKSYVLPKPKDFQPKMFKCVFRPSPSSLALPSQTGFLGLFFWRCGVCFLHNQFLGKVPHVYS